GATYGLPFPPLEDFQSAGAGESLELLLPAGGPSFRTNLALVDLGDAPKAEEHTSVGVEIYADAGALLDRFEADVPIAGGIQMTDLFRSRGLGDGHAAAWIRVSPAGGRIAAYATVIDQGTNAPLYAPASLAQR
ncbi:MAG TPA: hypothetical protein VMN04_14515, partial [Thermoanaerobaculia bacterium]|nr:hypothetical protein [Thermoanaerobaculia bacterium]